MPREKNWHTKQEGEKQQQYHKFVNRTKNPKWTVSQICEQDEEPKMEGEKRVPDKGVEA